MLNLLKRLGCISPHVHYYSVKATIGIVGLKADPEARTKLRHLYTQLIESVNANNIMPASYPYRQGLLALTRTRLQLLDSKQTNSEIEGEIGEGQLEELVEQAQEELELLAKMKDEWRPWEPLVEKEPEGTWNPINQEESSKIILK